MKQKKPSDDGWFWKAVALIGTLASLAGLIVCLLKQTDNQVGYVASHSTSKCEIF